MLRPQDGNVSLQRYLRQYLNLALLFAGIFAAVLGADAALAKPTLPQAVDKLDGKYLKFPDFKPQDHSLKVEAGGTEHPKRPMTIARDGVTAKISYLKTPQSRDMGLSPLVKIFADARQVAQLSDDGLGSRFPFIVQIAEIDPANTTPEVVVSFYTGGAHCCGETKVVTKTAAGWRVVDVGSFNGGALAAADLDGDGRYEFGVADPAFLYTFGCYACSTAPLMILTVENGKVKNVSAEPAFHEAQGSWMKMIVGAAPASSPNAFLAGYVAEKCLLGEGAAGWKLMLAYYDRQDDWGLQTCSKPLKADGSCPVPETKLTFPQALERTLKENHYRLQ